MQTNATPFYNDSVKPTKCCAKFNAQGWDDEVLHFDKKPFVHARSRSLMHIPLNMGSVFGRVMAALEKSGTDVTRSLVLSHETSPWGADHYFAVDRPIAGEEVTTLSGDFITKVFEGPYRDVGKWSRAMTKLVAARGKQAGRVFFFYTTCPECAKIYGENYVVGVAEML